MAETNVTNNPTGDPTPADIQTAPGAVLHGGHGGEEGHGGVKFEPRDIDVRDVFVAGLVLVGVVVVCAGVLIGFYFLLLGQDNKSKLSDLPVAAGDVRDNPARMPPEPRLEAIDDLRPLGDNRFELLPRRAEGYLAGQEGLLRMGDADHLPVEKAIAEIRLPARPVSPPHSFSRRLPSRAASGRVETGGQ